MLDEQVTHSKRERPIVFFRRLLLSELQFLIILYPLSYYLNYLMFPTITSSLRFPLRVLDSLKKKQKTILVPVNHGFAYRYFFQTDIFKTLQASGNQIVIMVENVEDPFFKGLKEFSNVALVPYQVKKCEDYLKKSAVENWLKRIRLFTLSAAGNIQTVKDIHRMYLKDHEKDTGKAYWLIRLMNWIVCTTRHFWIARRLILWVEQYFYTPKFHADVFEKYQPDLLVVSSLGTFDYDQYVMREARARRIPVASLILSWDNTTTRGMPGAIPDYVLTWTEVMRREAIHLNDIRPEKIRVCGVAHFDHYHRESTFLKKEEFYRQLKLDPDKKLLFFVTKSPNGYAWNADIAEMLLKAIQNGQIQNAQILVRLHPIYYRRMDGKCRYQNFLNQFYDLKKRFPDLILNEPVMDTDLMNFSMPENEIRLLASLLKYSQVLVNMFSTLNIEASIFDLPCVNVCFEGQNHDTPMKARYNIAMDEAQTHNQRVVQSGAIQMVRSEQEMIEAINLSLKHPEIGCEARRRLKETECGLNPGTAGETIAETLLELIQKNT